MKLLLPVALSAVVSLATAAALAQSAPRPLVKCTWNTEQDCLAKMSGIAHRSGNVLRITLANGETKSYETNKAACEDHETEKCIVYTVMSYVPASGHVAILARLYEGSVGVVVNVKTGHEFQLDSSPDFSPDGRRFVVIPDHSHYAYDYAFTIWRLTDAEPLREYVGEGLPGADVGAWFWTVERWEGNRKVVIKAEPTTSEQGQPIDVVVALTGDRWQVVSRNRQP